MIRPRIDSGDFAARSHDEQLAYLKARLDSTVQELVILRYVTAAALRKLSGVEDCKDGPGCLSHAVGNDVFVDAIAEAHRSGNFQ